MRQLHDKWSVYQGKDKSAIEATKDYEAFYIDSKSSMEYAINTRPDRNAFHVASECVTHFNIVFPVGKGSPYAKAMSKVMATFSEFGLIDKWLKDAVGDNKRNDFYESKYEKFTLHHLQGIFMFMLWLLFCSLIIFAKENSFYHITDKCLK